MNYKRGDVVIVPFPFMTASGSSQKARPALIISDHTITRRFNDVILLGITSQISGQISETELLLEENSFSFKKTGLAKTSLLRSEYVMTIPSNLISRKLGGFSDSLMLEVDKCIKQSIGLH